MAKETNTPGDMERLMAILQGDEIDTPVGHQKIIAFIQRDCMKLRDQNSELQKSLEQERTKCLGWIKYCQVQRAWAATGGLDLMVTTEEQFNRIRLQLDLESIDAIAAIITDEVREMPELRDRMNAMVPSSSEWHTAPALLETPSLSPKQRSSQARGASSNNTSPEDPATGSKEHPERAKKRKRDVDEATDVPRPRPTVQDSLQDILQHDGIEARTKTRGAELRKTLELQRRREVDLGPHLDLPPAKGYIQDWWRSWQNSQ